MNKKKIFNDPVYGFINIESDLIFDIIEHPYFQKLRRIKQLGVTDYVYPGALHTRFHHALGAMHLMGLALHNLRGKGHTISDEEYEAAQIAILLHDIGHGPFSHALESSILENVPHEQLSLLIMEKLNHIFNNKITLAIQIFKNQYHRPFFNQLIMSQLDIDRMDYLQRDCFFTGVSEGTIGADRIIKMLDLHQDELVVEEKGIYSIENFLNARRLMYWQVYLHKTSIAAEQMLIQIFKRAKHLAENNHILHASDELLLFLKNKITFEDIKNNEEILHAFASLDDTDIWGAIKIWKNHPDHILSKLSLQLLNRKLFKIKLSNEPFERNDLENLKNNIKKLLDLNEQDVAFYVAQGQITNAAYVAKGKQISIITKKGEVKDVADASDLPNIKAISKIVTKYYVCHPKEFLSL